MRSTAATSCANRHRVSPPPPCAVAQVGPRAASLVQRHGWTPRWHVRCRGAPEKQRPVDAAVVEGVTLDGRGTEPACRFLGAIDPGQRSPLERRGTIQQLEDKDAQRPPLHRELPWPAFPRDDLLRGTRACGVAKPSAASSSGGD
jgi:hypothetical protein